jgi:hypothetical protein
MSQHRANVVFFLLHVPAVPSLQLLDLLLNNVLQYGT